MKTNLKKLLSVVLALCLVTALCHVTAFAETPTLALNTPTKLSIVNYDEVVNYKFTPSQTGEYLFASDIVDGADPYIYGFENSTGDQPPIVCGNSDDFNETYEFWAVYSLKAGEEYTLGFSDYNNSANGFYVTASKYLGVIKQPTPDAPSVTASFKDEVASYQWYKIGGLTPVTNTVASPYVSSNNSSSYNGTTGEWTGVVFDNDDSYWHSYFKIELKAGATLIAEISEEGYYAELINDSDTEAELTIRDNILFFKVTEDGTYELNVLTETDTATCKASYANSASEEKLEGETEDIFKGRELDKFYFCRVTYKNGTVLDSQITKVAQTVLRQPTVAKPSVEVTYSDAVKSYQWYDLQQINVAVNDNEANPYREESNTSTYNGTTGEWTGITHYVSQDEGYWHHYFSRYFEAGDKLTVKSSDTLIDATLIPDSVSANADYTVNDENDTVTFTITEDDVYVLRTATNSNDSTVKAEMPSLVLGNKLEGQTTDTLTEYKKGTYYACAITYNDGTVIFSEDVIIGAIFTHSPTFAEPYATVNYSNDVKAYKGYHFINPTGLVTEADVKSIYLESLNANYNSATGEWSSDAQQLGKKMYCYTYFNIELKAGDVITAVAKGNVHKDSIMYNNSDGTSGDMKIYGKIVTFTAKSDGVYSLSIVTDSADDKAKCYLNGYKPQVIENQTTNKLTATEEGIVYYCEVTYNDGEVISSDSFTATATTSVVIKLSGYSADTVTSADEQAIKNLLGTIETLLKSDSITADEREALTAAKAEAEKLIAVIEMLNSNGGYSSATGDNSTPALWLALLIISSVAIAGITVYKKKIQ